MLIRIYRFLKRAKLRTKLFISFLAVALLPMIGMGAFSAVIARDSLRDQLESRVADYVDRAGTQLDAAYGRCQEAMDRVVYGDELLTLVVALQNSRIRVGELRLFEEAQRQAMQPVSASIRRVDFLLGGDPGLQYNNKALEKRVEEAVAAHPDNAAMLEREGAFWFASEDSLYAVRTVPDLYSRREAARMVVTMNKREFFSEAFAGENSDFGILVADNNRGSVISLVKNVMTTGIMPISYLDGAADGIVSYNGAQYLYGSVSLQAHNWTLYALVSYQFVIQRTGDIVRVAVVAIAAGIGLIALIALLLSSNFAKRIEFLIRQMKKVSKGNWLIERGGTQADEIGQLSQVFEGMVAQLETLIHDVYESQLAQRESEFKALQTQINPHFLYNCLDNMNWYAIMRGDEHSSYVITQLSDYYRTCLSRGRNTITVEEELKNAAAYMNLQLELHDNNFQFEKDIEEGLEEFVTINLMLQPLLENAVKHGVDKLRDKSAKRLIRLTARREGGDLRFTVYNTGSVIQPQVLRSVFVEKTQGYGLRNVDERIRLLFGEAYGIRIEGTEDGTLCVITIPQRREEDL